jgi:hypothetical protein
MLIILADSSLMLVGTKIDIYFEWYLKVPGCGAQPQTYFVSQWKILF